MSIIIFFLSVHFVGLSQQLNYSRDYTGNLIAKDNLGNVIANGSTDNMGNFIWKDPIGNILYTFTINSSGKVVEKDKNGNIIGTYEKAKSPISEILQSSSYTGNPTLGGYAPGSIDLSQASATLNNLANACRNSDNFNNPSESKKLVISNQNDSRDRQELLKTAFIHKEKNNRSEYVMLLYKAWGLTDFDGLSSYYLAQYLIEEKSFTVAQDYIDIAVKKNAKDADFLALKSYIEFKLNNIEASKKYYKSAIKLNKQSVMRYTFNF